jgi:HAD superfamily hydrolase (TIGR01509 family)
VIKAVIFDVDGTLIDTVDFHAYSWVRTFEHFGVKTEFSEVRQEIGKGADRLMPLFLPPGSSEQRQKEIEEFRSALFKREYLPKVRAFPKVRALFQRIRSCGQRIVLGSSCTKDEIGCYKRIADIADVVDCESTSDDANSSKPAPDIFLKALERGGRLLPEEAVVVGDTPYDAEAAKGAGIACVGVLCGGFSEDELSGAGCLAVYRDPAHLLREYDNSPLVTLGDTRTWTASPVHAPASVATE